MLFLSKALNTAEKNYWATELEVGALVWTLGKLQQYVDMGNLTIYTDHEALKAVFKSTGSGKRSNRLNNWALFLSKYAKRMEIIYQSGKTHCNADGLLCLKQAPTKTFLTDVITIEPNLKKLLIKYLPDN